ncbi:MAG TPA: lysylphosphatidylglycerol synthase transmembrane domain-containing protein [Candidatus Saccharimonadales bacterium]|nr:lysylphosphatidylglycerol synthase transmembrane domain-containing protein [Candidatus Saccharimonadales bacterium]
MMQVVRKNKRLVFIAVACVGIVLLATQLLNNEGSTLRGSNLGALAGYGAAAIALQMLGHWLRAVKHRYLLEQIRPIRTIEVFKGQMIGLLFNTILPFRLGELVRAHYIGKGVSISRSAVFATILFERLIDTAVVVLMGLLLLTNVSHAYTHSLVYTLGVLLIGGLALGVLLTVARMQQRWLLRAILHFSRLFNRRLRNRIRMMCWSAIYCLKNVITLRRMPRYLLLTVIMWMFYLSSAFVLVRGMLMAVPLTKQVLAAAAVYFGVSVPSGPAYIGTFRRLFSNISTIPTSLLNSTHSPFALWLLLIAPTTVLGFIFLLSKQHLYYRKKSRDALHVLRNKLYRDKDITSEFAHFLDAYFNGNQLNRILTAEELSNNFQVLKTFKGGSNALTLLAWQDDRMVVKKITLKQYEEKLRAQYLWLKERESLPEITHVVAEHRTNDDYYAIDIEYLDDYVPFFDVIHSSSARKNKEVLRNICAFVDKRIYTKKRPLKNPRRVLNKYIDTKAIGKITDAASANLDIAHLLTYDMLTVNGRDIKNFEAILEEITHHKQAMADLTDVVECPIQGDLTIDNIIVKPDTGKFVILDPNNENAISDPIVDYAKLMQSVHSGYEFLYTLPACKIEKNNVNFEERRSAQYDALYADLCAQLQERLSPGRYRAILFHEAVHYCRMLTYRVSINPDTAAAFYAIAVRLFNDFMEQYDDRKS